MATTTYSIQNIGIRYGIVACLAMIAYFFLINLLELQDIALIRFAGLIFILLAVVFAIGALRRQHQTRQQDPYLPGLAIGFLVGLVGSMLFAAFIFIHAHLINPDYAATLENQDYYGLRLSPLTLAGSITLLGTAVGAMTGYILMMAFDKPERHTKD